MTPNTNPLPHVTDLALSQRLERAEAKSNAAFVDARAHVSPSHGAEWRDVSGTYAMFDGVDSPLTQTFGLGLFAPPTNSQLDELESFFQDRGAEVFHEVSPLADPTVLSVLSDRGYRPIELTSVMHMRLTADRAEATRHSAPELRVRTISIDEAQMWADTSARGWGETPELIACIREIGAVSVRARGTVCFVAEWSGQPIG